MPVSKREAVRKSSEQQYQEFSESDTPSERRRQVRERTLPQREAVRRNSEQRYQEFSESDAPSEGRTPSLSRDRVSSMAPNFRVIKFINDQAKMDKTLYQKLADKAVELGVKGVRPGLMRLIARTRKVNSEFNVSIQNLTKLDYQLAKALKGEGKTNEEISVILQRDKEIVRLVTIVVNKIRALV